MSLLRDRRFLIITIAILATIKFVILPIITWQNKKLVTINRQNYQLVKGLDLLKNQTQLTRKLQQLKKNNQQQLHLIARNDESSITYQLTIQKKIEALLEKHQLKTRSTTWLNTTKQGNLEKHRLEIALSGSVKQFVQFISEVEQLQPKLVVLEYRSIINNMYPKNHRLGRFFGKFILIGWRETSGQHHE